MKTILCFGDSNTWGYDAATGGRFAKDVRWTGQLANLLGEEFSIIEEGLSGRTSVFEDPLFDGLSGSSYIRPCILSHSPLDLVVIMLGTNDTKERFHLTPYNIAQGIVKLTHQAKQTIDDSVDTKTQILIISPPVIKPQYFTTSIGPAMGSGCDQKSNELANYLEELVEPLDVHFLNAANSVEMNEVDYMHLDQEGHRLLAQLVFNKIQNFTSRKDERGLKYDS